MLAVWYERQGADRGVAGRRDAGSRARPCRTQTWRGPAILAKFALHCLTGRPHLVRGWIQRLPARLGRGAEIAPSE
jgi:hypothetical protein